MNSAGGSIGTAPVDAVAFCEAFIGRDQVAAVHGSGDNQADQAHRSGPPQPELDFRTFGPSGQGLHLGSKRLA